MASSENLRFLDRNCAIPVDSSLKKNKWRWSWLEELDHNKEYLSVYVRKLQDKDGVAWCCYCKKLMIYKEAGKCVFQRPSKTDCHLSNRKLFLQNQSLPAAFQSTRDKIDGISCDEDTLTSHKSLPYGCPPNVDLTDKSTTDVRCPQSSKPVSLKDRVAHQQALLCSFIAEHSLPLTMASPLITLAQELASDKKALSELKMERQAASYKLTHGLAILEHKNLVGMLKTTPFSLNIDESTSKGNKKRILNVLVCFFDKDLKQCVTHLYASIEMTIVNAQTVFDALMEQLRFDCVPLTNLMSILTDSAAYMRGHINGFQAKIRDVAPHLLDIDGDICHHLHNSVKVFTEELDKDKHLTRFLDDIFKDFELSADLRQDLLDIANSLKKPEYVPLQRASHRWMSIFDSSVRFLEILDSLTIFYSAWLTVDEKKKFQTTYASLLSKVKKEGRVKIYSILQRLQKKGLTSYGKQRKVRIVKKLFHERELLLALANTYKSVLPMFKEFILTFEKKEPMVHKLYDEISSTFSRFLACFIKHEHLNKHQSKLHKIDLTTLENMHAPKDVFIGEGADRTRLKSFQSQTLKAFKNNRHIHAKKTSIKK